MAGEGDGLAVEGQAGGDRDAVGFCHPTTLAGPASSRQREKAGPVGAQVRGLAKIGRASRARIRAGQTAAGLGLETNHTDGALLGTRGEDAGIVILALANGAEVTNLGEAGHGVHCDHKIIERPAPRQGPVVDLFSPSVAERYLVEHLEGADERRG